MPVEHQRLVHESPGMGMLGILAAELGEELAALELQVGRAARSVRT
jgi:hypothetical protein